MTKFLKISAAVALVSVAAASFASAGLNAGGSANLYWSSTLTGAPILGAPGRNSTSALPNAMVTVKGLNNFRGCDVQLVINALDGGAVPAAWQAQSGGCAEGTLTFRVGGGVASKNPFTTAPAVMGVVPSQNGQNYGTGDCRTPHGVGLYWLSAAGANGGARNPATEYTLWVINFDMHAVDPLDGVTPCEGGADDPAGPRGICINPNFRIPCNDLQRGAACAILDGNLDVDYYGFGNATQWITWNAQGSQACPGVTASKAATWGGIKKLYK